MQFHPLKTAETVYCYSEHGRAQFTANEAYAQRRKYQAYVNIVYLTDYAVYLREHASKGMSLAEYREFFRWLKSRGITQQVKERHGKLIIKDL